MIEWTRALAAGAAVQLHLAPPLNALRWRVLRKDADAWTSSTDPNARLIYEGNDPSIIDDAALTDGVPVWYAPFYEDPVGVWTRAGSVSVTPASTWLSPYPDTQLYLRERLDVGLRAVVQRGVLRHERGRIPVLLGPPALDSVVLPVVTLHLTSDAAAERGLGDSILSDTFDAVNQRWKEHDGWLDRVQIAVVGWSLNGDERALLRRALRDVVIANLALFNNAGMSMVEFQQQDVEDMQTFNAPMYQTVGTFSCLGIAAVDSTVGVLTDVRSTLNRD